MAGRSVIPVALLGLGTVGGGVYELFQRQKDQFFPKAGAIPMITRILVRDMKKPRPGECGTIELYRFRTNPYFP